MGPPSQKVLSWLHNVLASEYRFVDRTFSDVAQTLSQNTWLALRTDVYAFEQGHSSLLLNIYGPLPVTFRGTTYAFPISIWVPREYPQEATIQFVTPSKDMVIRPGQYVSGEGRIYHPYLHGWRSDRSNIAEFLSIIQANFAKEPPLIARPNPPPALPPAQQRKGGPPPIPPLPPELGRSQNTTTQGPPATGQPPPPPPKPFDTQRQDLARHGPSPPPITAPTFQSGFQYAASSQSQVQSPIDRAGSAWDGREQLLQPTNNNYTQNYAQRQDPTSPVSPRGPNVPTRPWLAESQGSHQSQYIPNNPPPGPTPYQANSQRGGPVTSPQQNPYPPPNPLTYNHQTLPHRQQPQPPKPKPPEDLLTSPFEAPLTLQPTNLTPPPIPRNPQKDALLSTISQTLGDQVRSKYAANVSAIAPLKAQQAALITTLNNVNTEISQLNELEKLLSSNEKILHQAMREADVVLEDAKNRQVPDVDEVLTAPTVVARQIYEAVADERAIEDCRGVLMKALDRGRIGSEIWAKQTRGLAREEFLKKALIKKIARGMGLVEEEEWFRA